MHTTQAAPTIPSQTAILSILKSLAHLTVPDLCQHILDYALDHGKNPLGLHKNTYNPDMCIVQYYLNHRLNTNTIIVSSDGGAIVDLTGHDSGFELPPNWARLISQFDNPQTDVCPRFRTIIPYTF